MDELLLRKLKMYRNVLSTTTAHKDVWITSMPFKAEVDQLEANLKKIDLKSQKLVGSKGASGHKKQMSGEMLEAALIVCGAGIAYANQNNDKDLICKFDFTKSSLAKGNEKNVYNRCVSISIAAEPILNELMTYNMPANQLTILNLAAKEFDILIAVPREVLKADKSSKEELILIYDDCDLLLDKRMDKMMLIYQKSESDYFKEYTNARIIGGWHKKKDKPE